MKRTISALLLTIISLVILGLLSNKISKKRNGDLNEHWTRTNI